MGSCGSKTKKSKGKKSKNGEGDGDVEDDQIGNTDENPNFAETNSGGNLGGQSLKQGNSGKLITMPIFRNPPNTEMPISISYHLTATGVAQTLQLHWNDAPPMMNWPSAFAPQNEAVIHGEIPQSFVGSQFNIQPWMVSGIDPNLEAKH